MENNNDRPWTADNIRENASNWALQADARLLEFMQNTTKMIHERGNRTTHNLHKLILDLDQTKIGLDNASNQLMALQHKQFVENRVYDDDETIANVENVPIENTSNDVPMKSTMSGALQNALISGIKMVDKYFDKVSLDLNDTDDDYDDDGDGDEVIESVVLLPKDPYKDRLLPFLIGSKEWYEKWHVGLVESDTDDAATLSDNENENENENDDLESWSPSHSMSTNVPGSLSDSEPIAQRLPSQNIANRDLSPYSSNENLSQVQHESSFDTTDRVKGHEHSLHPIDPRDFNATNSIFAKQRSSNTTHVTPSLIDADPPSLDEHQPVARKKPVNIFLEDENDSNDFNIFDDVQTKLSRTANEPSQAQESSEHPRKNPLNSLGNDDAMLPGNTGTISSIIQRKADARVTNLFEDDDGDDLFASFATASTTTRSSLLSNVPPNKEAFLCNLFDDEPPDDDYYESTSKPGAESGNPGREYGTNESVSKKTIDTHNQPIQKNRPFKDELSDDDLNVFKSSSKLAADDSEISPKLGTVLVGGSQRFNSPLASKSSITNAIRSNIHDNIQSKLDKSADLEISTSIQKTAEKTTTRTSLFDEDIDDDEMFERIMKTSSQTRSISTAPKKDSTKLAENKSIWDSDEEAPLKIEPFKSNVLAKKPKNPYDSIRLFDDTPPDDDEDLFTSVTQSRTIKIPEYYIDFSESIAEQTCEIPKQLEEKLPEVTDEATETHTEKKDNTEPLKANKSSEIIEKIESIVKSTSSNEGITAQSSTARSLPKKLNMTNININVAALLPGARRVAAVEPHAPSEGNMDTSAVHTTTNTSDMIDESASQDIIDDSGRLENLNRNRAKLSVNRRPSTRRGRQQQYQESLNAMDSINNVENRNKSNIPQSRVTENDSEIRESEDILQSEVSNEVIESISSVSELGESVTIGEASSSSKIDVFAADLFDESKETISKPVHPETDKSFLDSSIFDDVDMENDDFDIFATKAIEPKHLPSTKVTPAFIDDLPPELDPIDDSTFAVRNNLEVSAISKNTLGMFGDDDDEMNDDGVFSIPKVPAVQAKTIDDYSNVSTSNRDRPAYSSTTNVLTSNVFIDKSPPSLGAKKSLSIFGGSDSDDDDIFGSSAKKKVDPVSKTSIKASVAPSTSTAIASTTKADENHQSIGSVKKIFDDESSDDDLGIFGGGRKSNIAPSQTENALLKVRPKSMTSEKLFSDSDDDDDDLFSSSSKKPAAPIKRYPAQGAAKSVKPSASSETANSNPLSDLLK